MVTQLAIGDKVQINSWRSVSELLKGHDRHIGEILEVSVLAPENDEPEDSETYYNYVVKCTDGQIISAFDDEVSLQHGVCDDCLNVAYDMRAGDLKMQIQVMETMGDELPDHKCIVVEEPDENFTCSCACKQEIKKKKEMVVDLKKFHYHLIQRDEDTLNDQPPIGMEDLY